MKSFLHTVMAVSMFSAIPTSAQAQNNCSDMIMKAVYDYQSNANNKLYSNEEKKDYCRAYHDIKSNNLKVDAEGKVLIKSFIGVEAKVDKSEFLSNGELICEKESKRLFTSEDSNRLGRFLNKDALEALVKICNGEQGYTVKLPDENQSGDLVKISITYSAGHGTVFPTVKEIIPYNLDNCRGSITKGSVLAGEQSLTCKRKVLPKAKFDIELGKNIIKPRAELVIDTGAAYSVVLNAVEPGKTPSDRAKELEKDRFILFSYEAVYGSLNECLAQAQGNSLAAGRWQQITQQAIKAFQKTKRQHGEFPALKCNGDVREPLADYIKKYISPALSLENQSVLAAHDLAIAMLSLIGKIDDQSRNALLIFIRPFGVSTVPEAGRQSVIQNMKSLHLPDNLQRSASSSQTVQQWLDLMMTVRTALIVRAGVTDDLHR